MSRDYLAIGSAPCEEECAQVGSDNYRERAQQECTRYITVLREKLGPEPEGASLRIHGYEHDFGTYYEVTCYFNDNKPEAVAYAYACEAYGPVTWDDTTPYDWRPMIDGH